MKMMSDTYYLACFRTIFKLSKNVKLDRKEIHFFKNYRNVETSVLLAYNKVILRRKRKGIRMLKKVFKKNPMHMIFNDLTKNPTINDLQSCFHKMVYQLIKNAIEDKYNFKINTIIKLLKISALSNDIKPLYFLGKMYYDKIRYDNAKKYLERATIEKVGEETICMESLVLLSELYYRNLINTKFDTMFSLLKKFRFKSDRIAEQLGHYYMTGINVGIDYFQAIYHYFLANSKFIFLAVEGYRRTHRVFEECVKKMVKKIDWRALYPNIELPNYVYEI